MKLCRTVVRCTQVENSKPSPKSTGSSTSQRVPTTINPMVKLSLLSRKQKRSSRTLQRPKVTPIWRCWLIVTPHRRNTSQRLLGRRTKTNLPTSSNLLKPKVAEGTLEKDRLRKLKQKFYHDRSANLPDLQKDDVVRMQPFSAERENMKEGESGETAGQEIVCSRVKWSALY